MHSVYRHLITRDVAGTPPDLRQRGIIDHRPMILLPQAGIWGDRSQPVARQACAAWPRSNPTAQIALKVGEWGCTLSRWPPLVTGIPERWW